MYFSRFWRKGLLLMSYTISEGSSMMLDTCTPDDSHLHDNEDSPSEGLSRVGTKGVNPDSFSTNCCRTKIKDYR